MRSRNSPRIAINTRLSYLICLFPIALFGIYWANRPFAATLAQRSVNIHALTPQQKINIRKSSEKLNGVVLGAGQRFSFNECVGPRTAVRGYLQAPSYIGGESPSTPGGGICVVSSILYQSALESGMRIVERVPHLRTMQTVAPGLDATVWFGGADLKFINDRNSPVEINCHSDDDTFTVSIDGATTLTTPIKISTREIAKTPNEIAVEVFRQDSSGSSLVSRDLYGLSFKPTTGAKTNKTGNN
jgi:vancomycin resistance protein VanW